MEESVTITVTEEKVVRSIKEQKSRAEQRLTHSCGRGSCHKVTAFGSDIRGPIQHQQRRCLQVLLTWARRKVTKEGRELHVGHLWLLEPIKAGGQVERSQINGNPSWPSSQANFCPLILQNLAKASCLSSLLSTIPHLLNVYENSAASVSNAHLYWYLLYYVSIYQLKNLLSRQFTQIQAVVTYVLEVKSELEIKERRGNKYLFNLIDSPCLLLQIQSVSRVLFG